jgi:hypothetical protein
MRLAWAWIPAVAVLAGGCGSSTSPTAGRADEGLALVSLEPASGTVSLGQASGAGCTGCATTGLNARVTALSHATLTGVNLWIDGYQGSTRCLFGHQDSPGDGFTLVADQPTAVEFQNVVVECGAPFSIDRIEVRLRSGDELVFRGSWPASVRFVE